MKLTNASHRRLTSTVTAMGQTLFLYRYRSKFRTVILIILFVCAFSATGLFSQTPNPTDKIDSIMHALHSRGQFDGTVLVAIEGRPIYRSAFGHNYKHGEFEPTTSCNIASLAKGFTAMVIMMLAEEGKLKYDDPIINYLPELKKFSNGITIRQLLTHTSGIPDVGDLGIDDEHLTNDKAVKALERLKSNFNLPGQKYQYSNTGYLLLASIAERVTKEKFTQYVTGRILDPLEMKDTRFIGKTVGMGEMESTIDDLLKWEESFYSERLVKQTTLEIAFTPYAVREGSSTYGFGWNIKELDGQRFVWHTGNGSGYRAFVGRMLSERVAVIMLTAGDSKRLEINDAIVNVIHGKPYLLPPMPIADKLYPVIVNRGIASGIAFYDSLRKVDIRNFDFAESQLNSLGYQLLGERKIKEAIEIFKLNTIVYPTSSNAFDSLGEGYYSAGDKASAVESYEKALQLDNGNLSSKKMLKKLK